MGVKAQIGDWFLGTTPSKQGDKIIYSMQVSEALPFEKYDADPRFEAKKPVLNAPWRQRCGDNLYYRDEKGKWQQRPNPYHDTPKYRKKDLRYPIVFIGEHFYYFGENAVDIRSEYTELLWRRQGCKCSHDQQTVDQFIKWLQSSFEPGIHGDPLDKPKARNRG
jgi:hypothetical protein